MAGAPASSFNGGVNYGGANLPNPITSLPDNLFQGTGINGLTKPTWFQTQTFNPTNVTGLNDTTSALQKAYDDLSNGYNFGDPSHSLSADFNAGTNLGSLYKQIADTMSGGNPAGQSANIDLNTIMNDLGGGNAGNYSISDVKNLLNNDTNKLASEQNSNVAGYDATNTANANGAQYLQQASIAQNRLLGELNQRGLLQSYENGGAGTADMANLSNDLQNSQNDQGLGLQNELSGLTNAQNEFDLSQNALQNSQSQFNQQKKNNGIGLSDIVGLGASALPIIMGL